MQNTAIFLIHCPDQTGIISSVSEFLYFHNGNIIDLEQHVDSDNKLFFMRVEWELNGFNIPRVNILTIFQNTIGKKFDMHCKIQFSDTQPRIAIFVSKMQHALHDILIRWYSGEWNCVIPIIVSNHPDAKAIAEKFGIEFLEIPINAENKLAQEAQEIAILEKHQIDYIVLAPHASASSPSFIEKFPNRIINIHHSFLPAFPGAKPYHSAFKRGVKLVGASAHYVTQELDAGPIIAQDVESISHRDSIEDLIRKGREIEKRVLSQAIWLQINHRILPYDNKTIIFD